MTGLTTYMWKEWRDQRVQVIGYALLVPVLMAIALLAIPGEWARMDAMPTFVAIGGLLIGALTIASDCVPGELRRGRLEFLARLPCDLRAPFVAKMIFVALALAGFCVYAWLCATTLSAVLAGGRWFAPFEWAFEWDTHGAYGSTLINLSLLDPLIVLSFWIFAVSCWLPRGTLSLPAALIVIALIGGPTALIVMQHHGLAIHAEELIALRLWLPASAVVAAALSFLRGSRHGRAPLRLVGWTIVGALFAAAPVWGWTANRWHDYVALDLKSDSLRLETIALGDGGRFVFANVQPCIQRFGREYEQEASHPVVIDLDRGTAREAGAIGTKFLLPCPRAAAATTPLVLVVAERPDSHPQWTGETRYEWSDGFDGRSGERLDGAKWKALLQEKGAIGDSVVRVQGSIVMPDGSRCWMTGRTLHVEARDGTTTTSEFKDAPATGAYWDPCGGGFKVGWNDGAVDVAARRFVSSASLREILSRCSDGSEGGIFGAIIAIRAGGWLFRLSHDRRGSSRDFVLWSPGDAAIRPAVGLHVDDWIVAALSDGCVLVATPQGAASKAKPDYELSFVDPSTGQRTPVAHPAGIAAPFYVSPCGALRSGARVFQMEWAREGHDCPTRFARIATDGTMSVTAEQSGLSELIGCPDEETVVVLRDDRLILRARFDGSPYEVVFPREESKR